MSCSYWMTKPGSLLTGQQPVMQVVGIAHLLGYPHQLPVFNLSWRICKKIKCLVYIQLRMRICNGTLRTEIWFNVLMATFIFFFYRKQWCFWQLVNVLALVHRHLPGQVFSFLEPFWDFPCAKNKHRKHIMRTQYLGYKFRKRESFEEAGGWM